MLREKEPTTQVMWQRGAGKPTRIQRENKKRKNSCHVTKEEKEKKNKNKNENNSDTEKYNQIKKKRCSFLLAVHRQASRVYNKTTTKMNDEGRRGPAWDLIFKRNRWLQWCSRITIKPTIFSMFLFFFFFFFFCSSLFLAHRRSILKGKKKNEKSFRRWGGRKEKKKYVKTGELREENCRNEENKVVAATHQRLLASHVWKVRCTCLPFFFTKLLTGQKEEKRWGKRG